MYSKIRVNAFTRFNSACFYLVCLSLVITGCVSTKKNVEEVIVVTSEPFGTADGKPVSLFTLKNKTGLIAKISNYGGTLVEMHVPDRNGNLADIVLGHDNLESYKTDSPYFGSTVGRVANRIANAKFTLRDNEYVLAKNNGDHHLHGGEKGWDKQVWEAELIHDPLNPGVEMTLISPDGDEGYPGEVKATVTYILTFDNKLLVNMEAKTKRPTPINMAHHSYWNLGGHKSGTVLDHELMIGAQYYTPVDESFIPTGAVEPVKGTPFDFRSSKPIGQDIAEIPSTGSDNPGGFDHNFVLNSLRYEMKMAAEVYHKESGRLMRVHTTEPGLQFYSGNFLNGHNGKENAVYSKHTGFCLESQVYPDAVNKRDLIRKDGRDKWPTVIINPKQRYRHLMIHEFDTAGGN